jgi:hypothetical protein
VDGTQLFKLAMGASTILDVAAWFNVSESTVNRAFLSNKQSPYAIDDGKTVTQFTGTFREIWNRGMGHCRISLRRRMMQNADKPAIAIFLAKNLLGYKDEPEETLAPTVDGQSKSVLPEWLEQVLTEQQSAGPDRPGATNPSPPSEGSTLISEPDSKATQGPSTALQAKQ